MASSKQTKPRPTQPKAAASGANGQRSARPGQGQNRPPQAQNRPPQSKQVQAQNRKARDRARARELAEERAATTEVREHSGVPLWLQLTTLVLSLAGLGVSIYMTIEHYTGNATLACKENSVVNCAAVTTSPESMVFGVFPVAVLGLAYFVFMVPMTTPWAWRMKRREVSLLRLASAVVGVGFILYLVYVELIQVGFICLWCTSVHVITFLLFGFIAVAAAIWGLPKEHDRKHPRAALR